MKIKSLGIIGLGYVGLPLAVAFSKKYSTLGYDINNSRINDLKQGIDRTNEIESKTLKNSFKNLFLTNKISDLKDCNIYIVTVPTPVNIDKKPDLNPITNATLLISSLLKKEDIVIYESTVYPGLTEEICVPILEDKSDLIFNTDFFIGYSPERINPGDKKHTIEKIIKVVSGSNEKTLKIISKLYKSIIEVGIYEAPSIKIAEAAKVIENSQRDINIAFVNELSIIFNKMGIDTGEVLKAAGTKWNFLNFYPGLVGGHCIGVDPYYLAFKSKELGYNPKVILSGREINDLMPSFIVEEILALFLKKRDSIKKCSVLILGATFKENCPDYRNSKVVEVYNRLKKIGFKVDVFDPWIDNSKFKEENDFMTLEKLDKSFKYDIIILAVGHNEFRKIDPKKFLIENGLVFDIKGFYKERDFHYL
ncbi:MAG: nucleotide sugar dehydrogenase [Flavobacteriaceae bacterium]